MVQLASFDGDEVTPLYLPIMSSIRPGDPAECDGHDAAGHVSAGQPGPGPV